MNAAGLSFHTFAVLIEDDAAVRQGIVALLTLSGVLVAAGEDEAEALQAVAAAGRAPDVLVINYRLGTEIAPDVAPRVLRALPALVPVIVITGDTSSEVRDEVRTLGWRLLIKPFQAADLLSTIAQAVPRP